METWPGTCFMIDTLERGGAQKQLLLMAQHLRENNRPPFNLIVFREPLSLLDDFKAAGTNVILIRKQREMDLVFLFNLVKGLKRINPKSVVTFLPTADMWGRLAALLAGVPAIGCSVRSLPKDFGCFRNMFLFMMNRFSDFIVCNSRKAAEITCERLKPKAGKVSVIYNGIEFDDMEELACGEEITIGLVARLVPVKDVSTLLRAFATISSTSGARVVIVGDGPLRPALEEEALALDISERVDFMGERPDAKEIIKQFDICVLTSEYEGLSNAIMEYMHAGKPVVATNVGGNPELVENGVTGYLFEPGNAEQLAGKLTELLSSSEKRVQMGARGREKIVSFFSVKTMVNSWETLLNAVALQRLA